MTTFLLIRHGSHDLLGKALAGRAPGVHLNAQGLREAARLAEWLGGLRVDAIYTSERERSRETAGPLAARQGLALQISAGIDEIDFGAWTRRTFVELKAEPEWAVWNSRRRAARVPGGEMIGAVQARIVSELRRLTTEHQNGNVALVSHCDVIKAALAHFLAMSLDDLERFDIGPASISVVECGDGLAKVKLINGGGGFAFG
jgi:broad specificity phosphatase PhoE